MQLVIVSNRLPVSVKKVDGKLEFYPSIGGLATGLASYASSKKNKWVGWPGVASDQLTEKEREEISHELGKHNCYPVFLTQKQIDDFYGGYSNSVLWPLFHESTISDESKKHMASYWRAYKHVNTLFAEAVIALSSAGNNIWVHDYQLLLLPALLRAERPDDKIGFFLHIPFPPTKIFSSLTHAKVLTTGMLGADLIGFHTTGYTKNYLDTVSQFDSGVTDDKKVILPDRVVRVTDFPMGIDYGKYVKARKSQAVKSELARLRLKYRGRKIILTVDRLDPAKGLTERVTAYHTLLAENPELHGKVTMVMLVVPSRTDLEEYRQLKKDLEKQVKLANQTFGTRLWKPIDYHFKALPFTKVTALYQIADIAFIAPLRDGMNLVAKEYLASKPTQHGVLILSKTAGAAEELKKAIMVDPAKPYTLVRGLKKAISMPAKDFRKRALHMQTQLASATVQQWAGGFMKTLSLDNGLLPHRVAALTEPYQNVIVSHYLASRRRLLLLDYDGTLKRFMNDPKKAAPSDELLEMLTKLAESPGTSVYIISGRSKQDLESWFGSTKFGLVAEHGAFTRSIGRKTWQHTQDDTAVIGNKWQAILLPVLERYASKTPGGFVEQKESSLVWHFRKASPYHAQKYLVQLKHALKPISMRLSLEVRQGNMILEVRPTGIHKGGAAAELLSKQPDFILAIGDDYTDEDTFMALPGDAHTVKVGRGHTHAKLRAKNVTVVHDLLRKLL